MNRLLAVFHGVYLGVDPVLAKCFANQIHVSRVIFGDEDQESLCHFVLSIQRSEPEVRRRMTPGSSGVIPGDRSSSFLIEESCEQGTKSFVRNVFWLHIGTDVAAVGGEILVQRKKSVGAELSIYPSKFLLYPVDGVEEVSPLHAQFPAA
jgi:hypothetical protein